MPDNDLYQAFELLLWLQELENAHNPSDGDLHFFLLLSSDIDLLKVFQAMELSRLELLTPSMPLRCATNCAIAPSFQNLNHL